MGFIAASIGARHLSFLCAQIPVPGLRGMFYILIGVVFALCAFPELRRGGRVRSRASEREIAIWRTVFLLLAGFFLVRGAIELLS
jgi:uncharacterized membrane protein YfcA